MSHNQLSYPTGYLCSISNNVPGGRCEKCEGSGELTITMHFLPDVQVKCPVCHGRRFQKSILEVQFQSFNISDILQMTIAEAAAVFCDAPPIMDRLTVLQKVGLGYLSLGQSATTLSGGEAQRIKLAKELGKRTSGHTLYLLDEPTTGLHPHDVKKLVALLDELVSLGNTVICVEHNLDVIAMSDWVVDFGPEGDDAGGEIIVQGTPETVAKTNPLSNGCVSKRGDKELRGNSLDAEHRILEFAFRQQHILRVVAFCHAGNSQAARVMKKIGMTREGRLRGTRWFMERRADEIIYAILDVDFLRMLIGLIGPDLGHK